MAGADPTIALEGLSERTWARLAELANEHKATDERAVTAAEFKAAYIGSIQTYHEDPEDEQLVTGAESPTMLANGCTKVGPYDIKIIDSVSVGVSVEYCPGANWSATLTAYLKVASKIVWTTTYKLSREHYSITFNPNVGAAKATITVGIFGGNHCLRVYGEGCYWWFGWKCKSFDRTLHCFG